MDAILAALGAGTNDLFAAFLGSVCGALMLTEPTWKTMLTTVFIGTCVGCYSAKLIPIDSAWRGFATFIIGSFGTAGLLFGQNLVKRRFFEDKK